MYRQQLTANFAIDSEFEKNRKKFKILCIIEAVYAFSRIWLLTIILLNVAFFGIWLAKGVVFWSIVISYFVFKATQKPILGKIFNILNIVFYILLAVLLSGIFLMLTNNTHTYKFKRSIICPKLLERNVEFVPEKLPENAELEKFFYFSDSGVDSELVLIFRTDTENAKKYTEFAKSNAEKIINVSSDEDYIRVCEENKDVSPDDISGLMIYNLIDSELSYVINERTGYVGFMCI